jgi:hypothetical protein
VLQVATNPNRLGARTGVLAVLHSWGQNLQFHPHVHCVVPGGGLSLDRTRWVGSRPDYFLPVRVLSRVFRGKFLAELRAAYPAGRLMLAGQPTDQAAADAYSSSSSGPLCARIGWSMPNRRSVAPRWC